MIWKKEDPLPRAVSGHSAGLVGGQIVVAGGTYWADGAMHYSNECRSYSTTGLWTDYCSMPLPLAYAARLTYRDSLYIVGGCSAGAMQREFYRLDGTRNEWELLNASPQALSLAGFTQAHSRGWLVGGTKSQADLSQVSPAMWSIDLCDGESDWKAETPLPGDPRAMAATVSVKDKIFLFGGVSLNADGSLRNHSDAFMFDPATEHWQRVRGLPVGIRGASAVVAEDRYVILLGGTEQRAEGFAFRQAVTVYDTELDQYFHAPPLPFAAGVMDAVLRDGRAFAMGGEDKARSRNARMVSAEVASLLNTPRISVKIAGPAAAARRTKEKSA